MTTAEHRDSGSPTQVVLFGLAFVVGLAVALVQYREALAHFFIIDDFVWLHCAWQTQSDPTHIFNLHISNFFRPVVHIYFAVVFALFGKSAVAYHLGNLVVHALCTALLTVVARQLTRDRLVAAATGLTFALMSLYADAVVWVSAVTEPVNTLAMLGTLAFWIRFWGRARVGSYLGALGCFVLALGAKESSVSFLGVLALVHLALHWRGRARRKTLWIYTPFVVFQLCYMGFQLHIQQQNYLVSNKIFAFGWHGIAAVGASVGLLLYNTLPIYLAAGVALALGRRWPDLRQTMVTAGLLLGAAITAMVPYSMFGGYGLASRYLYFPTAVAALAAGLLARRILRQSSLRVGGILLVLTAAALLFQGTRLRADTTDRHARVARATRAYVDRFPNLPRLNTPILIVDGLLCGQQLDTMLELYHPQQAPLPYRCIKRKRLPRRWRHRSVWRWNPATSRFVEIPPPHHTQRKRRKR